MAFSSRFKNVIFFSIKKVGFIEKLLSPVEFSFLDIWRVTYKYLENIWAIL